ncbi:MAG: hypothetical protein JSU60_08135 [Nitrospirota bacterium]|nr:MAG: hypothetical protein JSU60_08135 [Nitrospirota bacterium]
MMHKGTLALIVLVVFLPGCTSTGTLGIITKSSANPAKLLQSAQDFEELGLTEGEACRHFILAIIPFGNSNLEEAVNKALEKTGGDALINVSATSSLYGFVPLYNVYSYTCTTVRGIAIKFK